MNKGKFIVFEGADGAGTTTQTRQLKQFLENHSPYSGSVITTQEPSDGPIGTLIREYLRKEHSVTSMKAMEYLFRADRMDHIKHVIFPALFKDKHVICDRSYVSTLVYQSVRDNMESSIMAMHDLCMSMENVDGEVFLRPDLVIWLDVSQEELVKRRGKRNGTAELYEETSIQACVCDLYSTWYRSTFFKENKVRIDSGRSIEVVAKDCQEAVLKLLN